jgi:hypothetical protein
MLGFYNAVMAFGVEKAGNQLTNKLTIKLYEHICGV